MNIPTNAFILIDAIVVLIFLISFFHGYKKGLIYQVLSLVSFGIAVIFAWILSPIFAKRYILIEASTNFSDMLMANIFNQVIWFIIVLVVAKVLFDIILHLSKIISKIPLIGFLNKILGALFGLIYGFIWTVLLSSLLMMPFFDNGQEVRDNTLLNFFNNSANQIVLFISDNIDLKQFIEENDLNISAEDIDEYRNIFENWMLEEGIFE